MTESEKEIRTALASYLDGPEAESSARFIAACNPVVITHLLARLVAAEEDAARYRFVKNAKNLCVAEWGAKECEWFDVDERRIDAARAVETFHGITGDKK